MSGDGCNPDCQVPCGNGLLDHPQELCDTAPPPGLSCIDYGFDLGRLGCSDVCTPDFARCGIFGWRSAPSPTSWPVYDVWLHAPDAGWAVTGSAAAVTFDGTGWSIHSSGWPELNGIWAGAPDDVWAAGDGGTLLHFDGTAWSQHPASTTASLLTVWGSSANEVWAAGQEGTLLHWEGDGWFPIRTDTVFTLWYLGGGAGSVWAVGEAGTVLRFLHSAPWRCQALEESCSDGVDNDCDGGLDCDDPECTGQPGC